jgi:hypothetical protein
MRPRRIGELKRYARKTMGCCQMNFKRPAMGFWVIVVCLILLQTICKAEDWSSCADDLDSLRRASRDAADAAEQAESARQEFESKKDELQNCIDFPEIYDLLQDYCQSARWDYESAKSDYRSALSNLEVELDTVISRFRSLGWSCEINIPSSSTGKQQSSKSNRTCQMLKSYRGKFPDNILFDLCKKYMSGKECRECLQIK